MLHLRSSYLLPYYPQLLLQELDGNVPLRIKLLGEGEQLKGTAL